MQFRHFRLHCFAVEGIVGVMKTESQLIPTRYKSKLASTLGWPIGAEELSVALATVPQFAELSTTFYFRGMRDVETARTSAWMTLMEFQYRRREKRIFDPENTLASSILGRHWEITVHPVLRERRKKLRDGILLQLPKVASWLTERQSLRVIGKSVLLVVWDVQKDTVYVSTTEGLEPEITSRKPD
jgi:hypothetical protein